MNEQDQGNRYRRLIEALRASGATVVEEPGVIVIVAHPDDAALELPKGNGEERAP